MKFPKSVVLELTYRCNHKCLFCSCPWENNFSHYEKGQELDVREWEKAIDILLDCGIKYFSLSGGEAVLKDGIKEIISYIRNALDSRNLATEITLISNGLSLTKDWLFFFKDKNVHLSISLPGIDSFKKHTGVDNVSGVLHLFEDATKIGLKPTANITVTKLNISELEKNIALALLHGANDILLNRFLPGGRGLSYMKELMITTKQVNEMLETAENILSIANKYGNVGTEIPLCSIDHPSKYQRLHIGYKCAAATGFFVIGPSGEVRTCNHSPKIVGNIFDDNIISNLAYWNTFANVCVVCEECIGCIGESICSCGCREVASILTSNINNADPSISLIHSELYK